MVHFRRILAFAFVAEVAGVGQAAAQPDLVVVCDFTTPSCQSPTSGGICPSSGLFGSGNWCVAPLDSPSSHSAVTGQSMSILIDKSCGIGNCFNQHATVPGCQGGFTLLLCVPPAGGACSPPVDFNGSTNCNDLGCTPVRVGNACSSPHVPSSYTFRSPGKYGVTLSTSTMHLPQTGFQIDVTGPVISVPALGTWGLAALALLLPLSGLLVLVARRRTRAAA